MSHDHAAADIDHALVDDVLSALQAAAPALPVPLDASELTALLDRHQLLGREGAASVTAPTLCALIRTLAAWRPDLGAWLAADALTALHDLPAGHTIALHAWPQAGFWRLARASATRTSHTWCWWQEDRLLGAPADRFRDVGLDMQECEARHARAIDTASPDARRHVDALAQALRTGIAQAAWQSTDLHVRSRHMFHRMMIDLPAIRWRMQQAQAMLSAGQYRLLRIELEQLQGGTGFMQESAGAQWLDWLYWANSLPDQPPER